MNTKRIRNNIPREKKLVSSDGFESSEEDTGSCGFSADCAGLALAFPFKSKEGGKRDWLEGLSVSATCVLEVDGSVSSDTAAALEDEDAEE